MTEYDCARVLESIDFYIDGELTSTEMAAIARHLEQCEGCRGVAARRIALRDRLRLAARSTPVPRDLASRAVSARYQPQWGALAIAAAVLLAIGAGVIYRSVSRISPTMQVGLQQHLHCAVPRTYPEQPELHLPAKYADILPIAGRCADQHPASGLRVAMAHECQLNGRTYVHVILRSRTRLASLLLTRRHPGEGFADDRLHESTAHNYSVAAFQTSAWLVYMVSDLDPSTNAAMLEGMSPDLRHAIEAVAWNSAGCDGAREHLGRTLGHGIEIHCEPARFDR